MTPNMEAATSILTPAGWVFAYFAAVSFICAFSMYFDRFRAERHLWRVPEATLLSWAFFGGALGGKLAQKLFRHKTRKQPFANTLNKMVVWNLLLYALVLIPPLRAGVQAGLSGLIELALTRQV